MFSSNHTSAKLREINRRLASLDGYIAACHGCIPVEIENFRQAALKGDAHAAEKSREEVIRLQGEIMDTIYARTTLMREAGYI